MQSRTARYNSGQAAACGVGEGSKGVCCCSSSNKLSTVSNEHIAAYQEARKQCQKWTTPLSLDMLFPGFLSQIMPTIMYIQSQKGPTKA
eukprot:scaffold174574_cov17-Tisochrysis_lutea.AAC.1